MHHQEGTLLVPFGMLLLLTALSCGSSDERKHEDAAPAAPQPGAPLAIAQVEDNIAHDTLAIQVTFDLGDGTYVMVASPAQETFEGLRLHRYRLRTDGGAEILATSSPAYDSWTMLPTFFRHPLDSTGWIVLANLGEKQSWGQKVFRLDGHGFTDLGFIDLARPARFAEEDGGNKLVGIGPDTRVTATGDTLAFTFACDTVHLFDDLRGGLDRRLPARRTAYRWSSAGGLRLYLDGQERAPLP